MLNVRRDIEITVKIERKNSYLLFFFLLVYYYRTAEQNQIWTNFKNKLTAPDFSAGI